MREVGREELEIATQKGLKLIYAAERDVARRVLAELNLRVHSGYDFNTDPDNITRLVGAVLNGTEHIHDVWPVGAAVWRCAPPAEKEMNAQFSDGTK